MKGALAHFKLEGLSTHKSAAAFISVTDRDPESRSQVSSFLRSYWLHLWPSASADCNQPGWEAILGVSLISCLCASRESNSSVGFLRILFEMKIPVALVFWFPFIPTILLLCVWVFFFCFCQSFLLESVGGCGEFYSHRRLLENKGPLLALAFVCDVLCFVSFPTCNPWHPVTVVSSLTLSHAILS